MITRILALSAFAAVVGCGTEASLDADDSSAGEALHSNSPGNSGNHKVTICHATGSSTNPYVQITVDEHAIPAHRRHQNGRDIIPAPAGGCPGTTSTPPPPPPPCDQNACGSGGSGTPGGACGSGGGGTPGGCTG